MQTSWIDKNLTYDENQDVLITLFMMESRGYYGYYYGPHAMLLIEGRLDDDNKHCEYIADYLPRDVSFPNPSVRYDNLFGNDCSSKLFLVNYHVRRNQYSAWKIPVHLGLELAANIKAQKFKRKEVANFSLRGGFWDKTTSNHNCITWAQHELSKIGIKAVCSKSSFSDKIAVFPEYHIGWVDNDSTNNSDCVLVANIHP